MTDGIAVFEHGETTKTIPIPIIDDDIVEENETFEVSLEEPTGGALVGKFRRTIVTILNDDGRLRGVQRCTQLRALCAALRRVPVLGR